MQNPYQRLREACGITQRAFAEKHQLSKMAVVYVEAGCWPDVPDRLNAAIAQECSDRGVDGKQILNDEYHSSSLTLAYQKWQIEERAANKHLLAAVGPEFFFDKTRSPFAYFVETVGTSAEGFGKIAKVNPYLVRRYAKGTSKSMPRKIHEALVDMEYPYTRELLERQLAWWQENVGK